MRSWQIDVRTGCNPCSCTANTTRTVEGNGAIKSKHRGSEKGAKTSLSQRNHSADSTIEFSEEIEYSKLGEAVLERRRAPA